MLSMVEGDTMGVFPSGNNAIVIINSNCIKPNTTLIIRSRTCG